MVETAERGYFFGPSCTPGCVARIVSREGDRVELLVAEQMEIELCRFGPMLVQSLHKHKADEQLLIQERMGNLLAIQRDIKRSQIGVLGRVTFAPCRPCSVEPRVPARSPPHLLPAPHEYNGGGPRPRPRPRLSEGRATSQGFCREMVSSSLPLLVAASPLAWQVAGRPGVLLCGPVPGVGSRAAGRAVHEVVMVFKRHIETFASVGSLSRGGRWSSQSLTDAMRVEVARALLLPQSCVRVSRPDALGPGDRTMIVITLATPDGDGPPRAARGSAEALVSHVTDHCSPLHSGAATHGLAAAFFVDSDTGGLVGASRATGGRVESCIGATETVEGWYRRQSEEGA